MDACRYYVSQTNRRVTFEWALIQGQTDTAETAHELGHLLRGLDNSIFPSFRSSLVNVNQQVSCVT